MTGRDIIAAEVPTLASTPGGRKRIAVIGIDRYHSWPVLNNAVRDATGALRLFEHLGFEPVGEPLLDEAATGATIQSFVTDELMALGPNDSLVLFFAGHGGTRRQWLGGEQIKTGYLIPADAAYGEKVATWIELDDWLRKVARLPPRHVLVILDACFAGIALTPVVKWRDSGTLQDAPLASLQARRSRRIITSALDDQVALDSGPVPGHSLFTGCLLEGFKHGQLGHGRGLATGTEVGLYLQQRVGSYPDSRQTPDFGTFEHDDRGEMVIPLLTEPLDPEVTEERPSQIVSLATAAVTKPASDMGRHDVSVRSRRSRRRSVVVAVAGISIALALSVMAMSSFVVEPSLAAEPSASRIAPRTTPSPLVIEVAPVDIERKPPENHDTVPISTSGDLPHPSGGSVAAMPRMPPPHANAKSAVPPSGAGRETAAKPGLPAPAGTGSNTRALIANAPPAVEPAVAKPRVRAPPNRRLQPAVDERDCPTKGSQEVTIDSFPPGAMLYLNHKECGGLGKTPWKGRLPPSKGTATGTFTAIFERTGQDLVTKEFIVEKSTRIQRVLVPMPPK
jgi:caspase domain-containing protein